MRGVYERIKGSGVWWINFIDAEKRRRRKKVGTFKQAESEYRRRKTEAEAGRKLPQNLRTEKIKFSELAQDALAYSEGNKKSFDHDRYRMAKLVEEFGWRPAEDITPQEMEDFLSEQEWSPATRNRYRALLKMMYREGIKTTRKIRTNPARDLRMRKEANGRVRFLNQRTPLPKKGYLSRHREEEDRLRAVIARRCPHRVVELEIALNTGVRKGEQYRIRWEDIDWKNRILTIPLSKTGKSRHVSLNDDALAAFRSLERSRDRGGSPYVFLRAEGHGRPTDTERGRVKTSRYWFEDAVTEAGIEDLTWHDLRHTFASRLAMAGVDLRTIADLMGHESIQMTLRYSHLSPGHALAAVQKIVRVRETKPKRGRVNLSLPEGRESTMPHTEKLGLSTATKTATSEKSRPYREMPI